MSCITKFVIYYGLFILVWAYLCRTGIELSQAGAIAFLFALVQLQIGERNAN